MENINKISDAEYAINFCNALLANEQLKNLGFNPSILIKEKQRYEQIKYEQIKYEYIKKITNL